MNYSKLKHGMSPAMVHHTTEHYDFMVNHQVIPDVSPELYANSYIFYPNHYDQPYHPTPDIPSTTSYPGQFNFDVSLSQPEKETKSTNWTYSHSLHKVYVRPFCQCPVRFRCTSHVPHGYFIRAMPVYMKPEHVKDVVKRCPNHSSSDANVPMNEHLVHCSDTNAHYVTDSFTSRQSVIVPFSGLQPGSEWLTYLYKFMCYGSCTGGLNRRPIQLVFTLENESFVVVGRQVVEVRICACPGRDRRSDELSHDQKREKKIKQSTPKHQKNSVEGVDEFNLKVKGKGNFQLLKGIRDYLYFISSRDEPTDMPSSK